MKWSPRKMRRLLRVYPPYLGAGVRVTHVAGDWSELHVEMRLRWYNRNAFGTHFGGSLYSMVDPHLCLLLVGLLGKEYVVWDRAARIEFLAPGRGTVRARIGVDAEQVEAIRAATESGEAHRPEFQIEVLDEAGACVARVHKTLHVRRKADRPSDE